MRNRSGDGEVRPAGFRSDSKRQPQKDSKGVRSRDSGMGWVGSGGGVEIPPLEERLADEFAFVRRVLPDEHPGFAVVALIAIRQQGRRPTRDSIRARLEASGRAVEQLREKGWTE